MVCILGLVQSSVAQETLSPLKYNPVYPNSYPQADKFEQKSFSFNFDHVCLDVVRGVKLEVIDIVQPNCVSTDGSFTIQMNNLQGPFTYSINGETIATTNSNTIVINNFRAGAYLIEVEDGFTETVYQKQFTLDNAGTDPVQENVWTIQAGFCSEKGTLLRTAIDDDLYRYTLFAADGTEVGDFNAANGNSFDLPPGSYYVRRLGLVEPCVAFSYIDVPELPVNQLPFIEDFSDTRIYPNVNRWQDNFAFVNSNYAFQAPSVGVATFDGLDQYGQPYKSVDNVSFLDGSADVLTSHPFCIDDELQVRNIDAIFLRFMYQAKGNGDYPNRDDSLFVEFKGPEGEWERFLSIPGLDNFQDSIPFVDTSVVVTDPNYFFNGMQFRFRNLATITGGNDHWNIDYVRLDIKPIEKVVGDVSFTKETPSILKNYQEMPWKQFVGHVDKELAEELKVTVLSLDSANTAPFQLETAYTLWDVCLGETIFESGVKLGTTDELPGADTGNFPSDERISIRLVQATDNADDNDFKKIKEGINALKADDTFTNRDSVIFALDWALKPGIDQAITCNDTLRHYQKFYNYYAFDDGSAEAAWGLNTNKSQVAYKISLNEPDTLEALQICFLNMNHNTEGFPFRIIVWQDIQLASSNSTILYQSESDDIIQYFPTVNGFWTYVLDRPIAVEGDIYVGIEQVGDDFMDIGFDKNTIATEHLFINYNGFWEESSQDGAVMMRPVFGNTFGDNIPDNVNVGIEEEITPINFRLFPNPTSDQLFVEIEHAEWGTRQYIEVYDFAGKQVLTSPFTSGQALQVSNLPSGMYLLRVVDEDGKDVGAEKFVKE